jgi:hypothetical protein
MRNRLLSKPIRAAALTAAMLLFPIIGCTDLSEHPTTSITPDQFYRTENEVVGGLASVYATMQRVVQNPYNLAEITTDEMIVPTRGQDWYDNGKWLDMHAHTFTPSSAAASDNIASAWGDLFTGVARANVLINAITDLNFASKAVVVAEARALRAYYYFLLQDLFGGVQIVTDVAVIPRARNTRAEVFNFIETELTAARADLPVSWPANMHGRLTKGAADAILASLYINAQVFSGDVTPTGLTRGPAKWTEANAAADRILASGQYSLATNWRSNFTADNYNSPEIIMAAKFLNQDGLGLDFLMRALHYFQYTPSPWNGFSTLAETYNAFAPNDVRRQVFLAGQAYNIETGLPVNDRAGNPLIFDPNIVDATAAPENAGVRITKWPNDPGHVAQNNGNDYATFRLAEIYLIKAEALNELGQTAAAIALINTTTRARAFAGTTPNPIATTLTQAQMRDAILQERLFELLAEGKRRQDLIRRGTYTSGVWAFKPVSPPYKVLMPIPQAQMDANPLLVQNPGY